MNIIRDQRRSRSPSRSARNSSINDDDEHFVTAKGERRNSFTNRVGQPLISFVDDESPSNANVDSNSNFFQHQNIPSFFISAPEEDVKMQDSHNNQVEDRSKRTLSPPSRPIPKSKSNPSLNSLLDAFSDDNLGNNRTRANSYNSRRKTIQPQLYDSEEEQEHDHQKDRDLRISFDAGTVKIQSQTEEEKKPPFAFWKVFSSDRPRIPISKQLTISWWDKWIYYGRFPGKAILQALVVIACTVLVVVMNMRTAFYLGNLATFYTAFWPAGFNPTVASDASDNTLYLHTVKEVVGFTTNALDRYFEWPSDSLEPYFYGPEIDSLPVTPILTTTSNGTVSQTFYLNGTYGPFGVYNTDSKRFLRDMDSAKLYLELWSRHDFWDRLVLRRWRIIINFDVGEGTIKVTMTTVADVNATLGWEKHRFMETVLFTIIILLSITLQILSFHSLKRAFVAVQRLKQKVSTKLDTKIIVWEKVPFRYKIRFFNIWFIVSLFAAICLIVGSILGILRNLGIKPEALVDPLRLFVGIGTLLSYAGLIRYLAFDKKYTILISALGRGLPNVMRFLLSALPLFIGYALLGTLYFGTDTIRFASFGEAAVTLFGLQNGDDIQNTLRSTSPHPIIGTIYFFTYIFLSIYAISNIFISIMQDAYLASKESFGMELMPSNPNAASEGMEEDLSRQNDLWRDLISLVDDSETKPSHNSHDSLMSLDTVDADVNSPLLPAHTSDVSSQKIDVQSEDEEEEEEEEISMEEEIQKFMEKEQKKFQKRIKKGLSLITQKHLNK